MTKRSVRLSVLTTNRKNTLPLEYPELAWAHGPSVNNSEGSGQCEAEYADADLYKKSTDNF